MGMSKIKGGYQKSLSGKLSHGIYIDEIKVWPNGGEAWVPIEQYPNTKAGKERALAKFAALEDKGKRVRVVER